MLRPIKLVKRAFGDQRNLKQRRAMDVKFVSHAELQLYTLYVTKLESSIS